MTDTPTSGTVSVSRELLERIAHNYPGSIEGAKAANELRAILARSAEQQDEPVGCHVPRWDLPIQG